MVIPLAYPDPGAEARALLHAIIEHGDVVGTDCHGRTVLALAVDPWTLDRLTAFDAAAADDEDDGTGAYSGRLRPPIPGERDRAFQLNATTDSGRSRPPMR